MLLIVSPLSEVIRCAVDEMPDVVQQRRDDQVRGRTLLLGKPRRLQTMLGDGDALAEVGRGATLPVNSDDLIGNVHSVAPRYGMGRP